MILSGTVSVWWSWLLPKLGPELRVHTDDTTEHVIQDFSFVF